MWRSCSTHASFDQIALSNTPQKHRQFESRRRHIALLRPFHPVFRPLLTLSFPEQKQKGGFASRNSRTSDPNRDPPRCVFPKASNPFVRDGLLPQQRPPSFVKLHNFLFCPHSHSAECYSAATHFAVLADRHAPQAWRRPTMHRLLTLPVRVRGGLYRTMGGGATSSYYVGCFVASYG